MPVVTITLEDTPAHGVSVHSDFTPAVGNKLSPAQVAAMEIILRTTRQWGGTGDTTAKTLHIAAVQVANYGSAEGLDIDRVHRQRDNVVQG